MIVKALSIKQPWAGLIACGEKAIEYRSWKTPHRGDLLVCASGGVVPRAVLEEVGFEGWRFPRDFEDEYGPYFRKGVALCLVELADIRGVEYDDGCFEYEWYLENPRPLRNPFPLKGKLKVFEVELDEREAGVPSGERSGRKDGESLSRGGNVSLTRSKPSLRRISVGLGWKVRETPGAPFELDAGLFMLRENGKVRSDNDFIFYNHPRSADGSVEHAGSESADQGDDETIRVDLERMSESIARLVVCVAIYEADRRKQSFGMVDSACIRVVDADGGEEIARYDLSEGCGPETAMLFGEIYRHKGEWKFRAVGQGFAGGLAAMATGFGVEVE